MGHLGEGLQLPQKAKAHASGYSRSSRCGCWAVLGIRWGLEHWSWEPEGEPLLKQLTQDCERHGQPGSCSASTHRVTHRCSDLVGQCWLRLQWEWLTVLLLRGLRQRALRLRTLTCKLLTSRSCRPRPPRRLRKRHTGCRGS